MSNYDEVDVGGPASRVAELVFGQHMASPPPAPEGMRVDSAS